MNAYEEGKFLNSQIFCVQLGDSHTPCGSVG